MGDGADAVDPEHEPVAALPAVAVPRPSESGWQVNWWGLLPLAVVGVGAFVGFRALGFGGEPSEVVAAPATEAPATSTTLPATTTTLAAPTTVATTVAAVPPSTAPAGPNVRAWGEVKPCRFGDACLAVSFTVSGFPDPQPTGFTCVYPNSTRQFTFEGAGEVEACLTGDEGDIVYIEVAGIRSGPVSAANLNP